MGDGRLVSNHVSQLVSLPKILSYIFLLIFLSSPPDFLSSLTVASLSFAIFMNFFLYPNSPETKKLKNNKKERKKIKSKERSGESIDERLNERDDLDKVIIEEAVKILSIFGEGCGR